MNVFLTSGLLFQNDGTDLGYMIAVKSQCTKCNWRKCVFLKQKIKRASK